MLVVVDGVVEEPVLVLVLEVLHGVLLLVLVVVVDVVDERVGSYRCLKCSRK